MDEDFSYYLDAARFRQKAIYRSQTAAIAAQQAKQPAKKDKQPKPPKNHEDKDL